MRLLVGTSGYSYKEWKGPFYPEKLPAKKMLAYYASKLSSVEINNTFYRMPKAEVLERWETEVPEGFVFVLKASRRITHQTRLQGEDARSSLIYLWETAQKLRGTLGPLLFQLPPYLRKDVDRLRQFLAWIPEGCRAVFEFRHASWFDESVYDALRSHGAALCLADMADQESPEIVATADWGYLRLRREAYSDEELAIWSDTIRQQSWEQVYVFFKHEEGAAPALALRFQKRFEAGQPERR